MSRFSEYLQSARQRTLDRAPSASAFSNKFYSGTSYALWRVAAPLTATARGLVLDAGSGRGGWRETIEAAGGTRETVDISPREDLTWQADLTSMPQAPSGRYDTVVCHQVLEHVNDPQAALNELFRVLKPGGRLILSAPHLSRLHELPHDYFRFTPNGMRVLLERAGFLVEDIKPYGGLLTFAHHQACALVLGLAAIWRPLFQVMIVVNAPICILADALDRMIDGKALLLNGLVVAAAKPGGGDPI